MPVVQMEDGTELEFPESMSREDMRSAILSKYPASSSEPNEIEKAAKSRDETNSLVRDLRKSRGVPPTTPLDSDEQRRADALQQIKEGQEGSKYYTEKARELGLAETALDIPGSLKALVNLPNRLTGQPDYPSLISPEQIGQARRFLADSREVPSLPDTIPYQLTSPEQAQAINAASDRAVDQLASGLTAPENVAALVAAKRFPTPISTLFAGETVGAIPETTQRLLESKSLPEAIESGIPTAANLLFAKGLGGHLAGPEAAPLPKNVRPFGNPSDKPIPFPNSTGQQEALASKARADYIAEQKAQLDAAEAPPVSEDTLNRLEQEGNNPEAPTIKQDLTVAKQPETVKPVEAVPIPETETNVGKGGDLPTTPEPETTGKTIPINPSDIQVGDRIFTTDYGYITVEKVQPFDPKFPRSQIIETSRGRRDLDPTRGPITVDRPEPTPKAETEAEKPNETETKPGVAEGGTAGERKVPVAPEGVEGAKGKAATIFGYSWDQIKSYQQGGKLADAIRGAPTKPKAKPADFALLEKHGAEWLYENEKFGVIDRLGLPMERPKPPEPAPAEAKREAPTAAKSEPDYLYDDAAAIVAATKKNISGTKIYTPAVKTSSGIVSGETHEVALAKAKSENKILLPNGRGFVTPTGEFLSLMDVARREGAVKGSEITKFTTEAPKPEPPKAGAEGEIVGMGGAVPGEFERSPQTATGIKNATVEQERAQRGLPPAIESMRRDFGEVWDRAMADIDHDPTVQDRLIESLREKPRAITDQEDALLLQRQVDLQNEYGKATRDLAQAHDDKRTEDVALEKLRVAELSDRLLDLYNINKKSGTETARGLNARKMMAYEDFTLAKMELDRRAIRGGAPLTDAERGEITRLQKQIEESQKAFDQYQQQSSQRLAEAETRAVIAEMGKQAAESRLTAPVLAAAERVVKTLHTRADAARARLKERLKRTSAGIDPTILLDVAEIGAEHLVNVGYDFAKWSAKMVEDVGDWVQEHLPKIWEASQKVVDNLDLNATIKAQIKRGVPPSIEDMTARIGQKMKDGALDSVTSDVQKLVRRFAEDGVKDMNTMIDKVWDVLKGVDPEITRRESMDAISGYGKFKQLTKDEISVRVRDLKGQMQQVAKLEDMQAGQAPLKTGVERRTPSDEERQLLKLVNEAKKKGGFSVTNPELQLASALQARKTYYRNRLSDLKQEIANREKLVKQKSPVPTDAALDALKSEYAKVKAQHDDIFKQQSDALKAYKTRLEKQYAELQAKLAAKDYTTKPRRKLALDPEAMRLKARNERLKDQWLQAQAAERLKNRTWWEKVFDWGALYRRAGVLSSPLVIPKLISAGIQRLNSLPLEDLVGSGLRRVPGLGGIADRAPIEGGGTNLKAEVTGWKNAFTTGMRDAYDVMKKGKSDLDVLYGHGESYTGESEFGGKILTFFGRLHGMLKAPVKRAVFERTVQRLGEYYQKNKLDLTDDLLKTRIGLEAYQAANQAIFLQDNFVASKVSQFLSEKVSKETGHATPGSKVWATAGRIALPIVKVPTNIVAETLQYAVGLGSGNVRLLAAALSKGVDKLTPAQSDLILRELKKGSLGAAVLALGYFNSNAVGGYYQPGQKRKPGDVKAGRIKVYGVEIPSWLLHNPLLETMQIGATVRRVADAKLHKHDMDPQGIGAGLLAGAIGVVEETPFIKEQIELSKLHDPARRGQFLNEQAKSILIPSLVQKTAELTDSAVKRKPHTLVQTLETGIPGLRGNVPRN